MVSSVHSGRKGVSGEVESFGEHLGDETAAVQHEVTPFIAYLLEIREIFGDDIWIIIGIVSLSNILADSVEVSPLGVVGSRLRSFSHVLFGKFLVFGVMASGSLLHLWSTSPLPAPVGSEFRDFITSVEFDGSVKEVFLKHIENGIIIGLFYSRVFDDDAPVFVE